MKLLQNMGDFACDLNQRIAPVRARADNGGVGAYLKMINADQTCERLVLRNCHLGDRAVHKLCGAIETHEGLPAKSPAGETSTRYTRSISATRPTSSYQLRAESDDSQ